MARKSGWDDSSRNPDWIDIDAMMRAMESLHSAHVAVIVSPGGPGFGTGVSVVASAIFEKLPGSELAGAVNVERKWPNNESATLTGHAYRLLHELDFEISKIYKQKGLWN